MKKLKKIKNRFAIIQYSILFFLFIVVTFPFKLNAQEGLLLLPQRVLFDESKNNVEPINLANIGNDTSTYVVSFVQYRMNDNGTFIQIYEPDSGQFFASDYLRFFPRKVTLSPRESQVVKVQLRNYRTLPDGEYRSYIRFKSIKDVNALGDDESNDTTSLVISITPEYGISMPIIIRKGIDTTIVNFSNLSLNLSDQASPRLTIQFSRTGNMSTYGDVEVTHVSTDNVVTQVSFVRGVAVYTPNTIRNFEIELSPEVDYKNGELLIRYKSNNDIKAASFAEGKLTLK